MSSSVNENSAFFFVLLNLFPPEMFLNLNFNFFNILRKKIVNAV